MTATVLAALLLALPGAVRAQPAAQEPPETPLFLERLDVEIVNLDVVVTDRRGRPVTGLTRDDFELRVGGEPTPIDNFYAVGPEGTRSEAAAPAPPPPAAPQPPRVATPPVERASERTLAALLWGRSDNPLGIAVEPLPPERSRRGPDGRAAAEEVGNAVATTVLEHDVAAPPRSRSAGVTR